MISRKALKVNFVADNSSVSRTAIYKHMKILSEWGLIVIKQQGRERLCQAQFKKLKEVSDWIEQYYRL